MMIAIAAVTSRGPADRLKLASLQKRVLLCLLTPRRGLFALRALYYVQEATVLSCYGLDLTSLVAGGTPFSRGDLTKSLGGMEARFWQCGDRLLVWRRHVALCLVDTRARCNSSVGSFGDRRGEVSGHAERIRTRSGLGRVPLTGGYRPSVL